MIPPSRDERWEDVYASIGPVDINQYPDPRPTWLLDVIEFRILVRYKGDRIYTVGRKHKKELERHSGDLYKAILDDMVRNLDKHLEKNYAKDTIPDPTPRSSPYRMW